MLLDYSTNCVEIAAHNVELTEVECENLHCRLSVGLGLVSVTRSLRDHGSESPVLAKTPAPNLGLTWILQGEAYLPRGRFGRTSISYDGSFSERMMRLLISFISCFGMMTSVG